MAYKFDKTGIAELATVTQQLQDILDKSLEEAKGFYSSQRDSSAWEGDAKKSFEAFLDLVTQYHEKVVESGFAGDFSAATQAMLEAMDAFEGNDALANLRSI